jgi:hypothetical protein
MARPLAVYYFFAVKILGQISKSFPTLQVSNFFIPIGIPLAEENRITGGV